MFPVSEAYKNAISQNERNVRIAGTITLKDNSVIQIDDEDILQGSLYFTEQCVSGEDIEIGNVYASEMGLTLTSPPENPYSLDGARIILNFGIETSEGVWEYVPLGYFYVTEIERKHTAVNLKALDGLILFDVDLLGVLTTGTPFALVQSCCTKAGVTLATSSSAFEGFANGLTAFTIPEDSKIETCRDLIMWVCQLTGTFARMNRMGQLEIVPVKGGTSVKTIDRQQRFTSDVSDSYVKITKVAMKVGDVEYSQGTDGITMVLEENPLLVGKSEAEINAILSNILNQVTTAEYVPYNVNFAGDPALQAGDYVTLTGIKVFDKVSGIFTRSSIAYLSDGTQVAANVPRFEQGKFGKAILIEEGTTNLANNPTFSGAVGTTPSGWNSDVTIQQDDFFGQLINVAELLCVSGNDYEDFGTSIAYPLAYNTTYTISFWARGTMEPTYELSTTRGIASATWKSRPPMNLQWQRYEVTIVTASSGSIYPFWWHLYNVDDVNVGKWVRIARIQLEQKPFATSFMDGTRAAETLTIPTEGVLNPQEGTVEFVVIPNYASSVVPESGYGFTDLGFLNTPAYSGFLLRRRRDSIELVIGTGSTHSYYSYSTTWNAKDQLALAVKWDTMNTFVLLNGQRIITAPKFNTTNLPSTLMIGNRHDYTNQAVNALCDDLRISNRAKSDEEILAAYQSGQQLPVDEWTTLKMNFDGSLLIITTVGDSIVTHSTWRYRGPHNIKAVGKSALVRGVQAQQSKTVSSVRAIAKAAQDIAQAANQSTQLINDAISGYVLIRKNETTGSNEILIMDNPDPALAVKIWRWNMGGLGYSDNVVGVDNPDRVYNVAMTMDGAINADFIWTGKLASSVVTIGPETTYEVVEEYTLDRYAEMTLQEIIDTYGGGS